MFADSAGIAFRIQTSVYRSLFEQVWGIGSLDIAFPPSAQDICAAPGGAAQVFAFNVKSGHCPPGTTEKVDCWPIPEVPNNIDMTVGNLGLTDEQENQIVAALQAMTDGFISPYPNIDTFTGKCMTGGNASTQGNETLIATPSPLLPCARAVCGVAPVPGPKPIH